MSESERPLRLSVVILAAGAGSRLGGIAKCLARIDGETLISRQIAAIQSLGAEAGIKLLEVIVVVGHHGAPIGRELAPFTIKVIDVGSGNPQAYSVLKGLAASDPQADGYLVCPADLPLLGPRHYRAVLSQFAQRAPPIECLGPVFKGAPGNPVVFDRAGRGRALGTTSSVEIGGGGWRKTDASWLGHWRVEDPAYVVDIDTPQDLDRLRETWGLTVSLPS